MPESAIAPPPGRPLTGPSVGVPVVPDGTPIVTDVSVAAVAVVKVYVYVEATPVAVLDGVQIGLTSVPPLIATDPVTPLAAAVAPSFVVICEV